MDKTILPTIRLRGATIHAVTEAQTVAHVLEALAAGHGGWVITPNLDHLRRLRQDARFREYYQQADLVVADGMPLVWASRLQGTPLPERVSGSNLVVSLSAAAAWKGYSLYLLGGVPGAAAQAAQVLQARFPGLRVVGLDCPPPGFEANPAAVRRLTERVLKAAPNIVYVALGSPKQEWLIEQLRGPCPNAWFLGVGISFSFLAGQVRRAPLWMQRAGLEWLHRLAQEPGRLLRRYLVEGLPFAAVLLAGAWANRGRTG